ncbi:MAG: hypothetical protein KDB14_20980 [Planctomycetales bacterium]|nr:hypothetical protein [Planctomycetales bacterium]
MRVLVTGMRAPVALDWARRLRDAGHSVVGADCLAWPLGRFSNALEAYIRLPSPAATPRPFAIALADLIQDRQIDVVMPTCEEVFYLATCKQSLPCAVLADSLTQLEDFHSKWRLSQWSGQTPPTHLLREPEDLQPLLENSVDWVFKPVYSRFATETLIGPSRWRVEQLSVTHQRPWVAQRRVVGDEFCTFSLVEQGQITAHAAYESTYRAGRGAGIYFNPIRCPEATRVVAELAKRRAFTGQLGCDFIREHSTGRLWLLEANPRATSGLHLLPHVNGVVDAALSAAVAASRDNANTTDATLKPLEPPLEPIDDTPWTVGPAMPFWGLISAAQQQRLRQFLADWRKSRDVIGRRNDLRPLLALPLAFAELTGLSWRKGVSPAVASTIDIQWDGEPMELLD